MRPTRLLLALLFFFLTVFLTFYSLLLSHPRHQAAASSSEHKKSLRSLFAWHTPSTLFPQSAIISLTDDNSTFFLGRPANYGPRLPTDGLSGQLWIGSGFSDDTLLRGGATNTAEGELGCSDIAGWDPVQQVVPADYLDDAKSNDKNREDGIPAQQGQSQSPVSSQKTAEGRAGPRPKEDDGSDDFLHWPLKGTALTRSGKLGKGAPKGRTEHADIQSLQESAEIAGKVVLLSRGGCGFLEKTKWVQRRGGLGLIVGDNIRGGPLTTMYANGDASNISIPSLFTTRTSAHLLSSLMPDSDGSGSDDASKVEEGSAKLSPAVKEPPKAKAAPEKDSPASNPTPRPADARRGSSASRYPKRSATTPVESKHQEKGWFTSVLSAWRTGDKGAGLGADSSRPPSSGRLSWVVSQDWDEDVVSSSNKQGIGKESKAKDKSKDSKKSLSSADGFVIGVQDWRDPDMMKPNTPKQGKVQEIPQEAKGSSKANSKDSKSNKELAGGSHTPGSGVYHQSNPKPGASTKQGSSQGDDAAQKDQPDSETEGWFGRLFSGADDEAETKAVYEKTVATHYVKEKEFEELSGRPLVGHEGLWVTMTPTTISSTPFFDTLLVLVVSPLVTLTVVYALLILRSRIRRRRWRAPKSVVDRLPVRTYHTMAYSSSATSSQATSPEASSPTSPLLRTNSRTMLSRARPRSRTTSMLADEVSTSLDKATARASLVKGERKRLHPKKYNGRQVECVVCLEEYIDGQSRVMSLPCGHEFHAECITPWLTTRRRTCPICKGDVVRSMASASSSSSSTDVSSARQLRDYTDLDDVQAEAALTRNESPSAAIPIPHNDTSDLELGNDLAATLVNDQSTTPSSTWNWRELASRSLSAVRGESSRQNQEDRSR